MTSKSASRSIRPSLNSTSTVETRNRTRWNSERKPECCTCSINSAKTLLTLIGPDEISLTLDQKLLSAIFSLRSFPPHQQPPPPINSTLSALYPSNSRHQLTSVHRRDVFRIDVVFQNRLNGRCHVSQGSCPPSSSFQLQAAARQPSTWHVR